MNQSRIPLSLYIHTPWCIKKCPYCDFNSHTLSGAVPESAYIDHLLHDLDKDLAYVDNRSIHSIFIGGGTPSLISANAYQRLFDGIKARIPFEEGIEITLEANPGTVEHHRFQDYLDIGINRLSLGIQSFNDRHLKRLGRIHGSDEARRAIDNLKQAGFTNFNLDIMHGLPEQTIDEAVLDVQTALSFEPSHFSWYQLTIEPNTLFYKEQPSLPNENVLAEIERQGNALLAPYHHYEISAFSKPGLESRHNLNYWTFGDYLGLGAGAHAKLSNNIDQTITRLQKKRIPTHYMKGDYLAQHQQLTQQERLFEFMLNTLRLRQKIDFNLFEQRTYLSEGLLMAPLNAAIEKGLMEKNDKQCWLTDLGLRYINDVQALFL